MVMKNTWRDSIALPVPIIFTGEIDSAVRKLFWWKNAFQISWQWKLCDWSSSRIWRTAKISPIFTSGPFSPPPFKPACFPSLCTVHQLCPGRWAGVGCVPHTSVQCTHRSSNLPDLAVFLGPDCQVAEDNWGFNLQFAFFSEVLHALERSRKQSYDYELNGSIHLSFNLIKSALSKRYFTCWAQ